MTHWKQKVAWQHLTTMVIAKICKMSIKGVKLKSESFFSISPGVLELWRKNLRGGGFRPPPVQIGLKLEHRKKIFSTECKVCLIRAMSVGGKLNQRDIAKQLLTPLRLIARMNFSSKNHSCELLNLTETVGKVELISTFTTES